MIKLLQSCRELERAGLEKFEGKKKPDRKTDPDIPFLIL
jgi:hypothetical protein